jgi:hypothetical protein
MLITRDKKIGIGSGATAPADYLTVRHGTSTGSTYRGIGFEEYDGTLRYRLALTGSNGTGDCYSLFYSNTGTNTIMLHATATSFITNGLKVGASGSSSYTFEVAGTTYSSTTWNSSDDRVKHNETTVENAIETIKKLQVKKYFKSEKIYDRNHNYELDGSGNPITDDKYVEECGIIAQQIKTIPELAFCVKGEEEITETVKNLKEYELDEEGNPILDEEGNPITYEETVTKQTPLGVNYTNLFCYNIKAVQELVNKVETLEQELIRENESLKSRVNTLETQVSELLTLFNDNFNP